jgi:hypothetical protein
VTWRGMATGPHVQLVQVTVDGWLAVAAISGDRAWHPYPYGDLL